MIRDILMLLFIGSLCVAAYNIGYNKAKKDLEAQFFEGPEGYCLVENHPGPCNAN